MSLTEVINQPPSSETLQTWLAKVPYASFLGITARVTDGHILFTLPPDDKLVGNPSLPAIHGGVMGAFMEQAGAFHLIASMERPVLPRIVNFSLDYLRAAGLKTTYASCDVTRLGRSVANVTITSWQDSREQPTAIARAHFLIPGED